ncbi:hypothetical protein LOK49_LG02G00127 [Camellia lanceoleosa]|uniref:Uncharacterized protein n=1 Tax=Camellia lanceoleosa TaxID=1840588 RepID=A0ACC0ITY2_9ERIC|nr:hypothetical protein LOK49_LG02G00127 [Camellia lanceoleosa]
MAASWANLCVELSGTPTSSLFSVSTMSSAAAILKFVIEQVEVEYVPEKAEFDGHLDEEFRKVFEKFDFKEIVGSEENDKKDETATDSASKKVDSDSEEEEQDTHQKEKGYILKSEKLYFIY